MPKLIDEAEIFDAVVSVFMSLGYDRATTKEIAEAAGVNEVTLFRKYGSKAGLFERAIAHLLADTPLNRISYTGDLETDLVAVVEAYLETNEAYGDIMPAILIELPRNPDLRQSLRTPWTNVQGILEMIQRYQRLGTLRPEPPLTVVSALIGPVMINQMFRRANLELAVPSIDVGAYVEAFLRGRRR